jgi:hemerythrin HHE cation binding domain-containing protein
MTGTIQQYLSDDHRRLEEALDRATKTAGRIEPEAYWEFRGGLLRHIGMEEKILLPAAQAARGGEALPLASRLHLDHGALAALLVLTPTDSIVAAIRKILQTHNVIEEGPGGVYSQCEELPGVDSAQVLFRLQNVPPVAMAEYSDNAIALQSARNALQRAGQHPGF